MTTIQIESTPSMQTLAGVSGGLTANLVEESFAANRGSLNTSNLVFDVDLSLGNVRLNLPLIHDLLSLSNANTVDLSIRGNVTGRGGVLSLFAASSEELGNDSICGDLSVGVAEGYAFELKIVGKKEWMLTTCHTAVTIG